MPRPPRQIKFEWERRLKPFNLDQASLRNQDAQYVVVPSAEPCFQSAAHDPELRSHWKKNLQRNHLGDSDLNAMHRIRVQTQYRPVPEWTLNDAACRAFLLWLYPKLESDSKQRARAGRDALIIFRCFRQCEGNAAIAEELDLPIRTLLTHIGRMKDRAEEFFSHPPGTAPPRPKRGRKKNLSDVTAPAPQSE
jgi:hypothetical protein